MPKPIPALHGPPSLPYARCPSGAEGIVVLEQSALPRMVWGLGDRSQQKRNVVSQSSTSNSRAASTYSQYPQRSAHNATIDPPSALVPSTEFQDALFTSTLLPNDINGYTNQTPRDYSQREIEEHHISISADDIFGPRLDYANTPIISSPYTEYHYADSPQWQEFVPGNSVIAMKPARESAKSLPSISASSVSSSPLSTTLLPSINTTLRDHRVSSRVKDFPLTPPTISSPWSTPALSLRPHQSSLFVPLDTISLPPAPRPKLRDLPDVRDRTGNIEHGAPRDWSMSIRQFWSSNQDEVNHLSVPSVPETAPISSPLFPPGIPLVTTKPLAPTRNAVNYQPEKSEPYTGALTNPQSIPLARLRRKLTTVEEEKETDLLSPRGRTSPVIKNKSQPQTIAELSVEAETQVPFRGVMVKDEGLRVRLPPKSSGVLTKKVIGSGGRNNDNTFDKIPGVGFAKKRAVQPKNTDIRRVTAASSSRAAATSSKENQPALASPTLSEASATSWAGVVRRKHKVKSSVN